MIIDFRNENNGINNYKLYDGFGIWINSFNNFTERNLEVKKQKNMLK